MTDPTAANALFIDLSWRSEAHAEATLADHETSVTLCAAVHEALIAFALSRVEGEGSVSPVSMTHDLTGQDAKAGKVVDIKLRTDRKTRTLLFLSALASSDGVPLVKTTAVFRRI
ncbi:MAG: hypothetical protein AAGF20_11330 [Pseudomonadota bacterium]